MERFLNSIEEEEIYHFNSEFWIANKDDLTNWAQRNKAVFSVLDKLDDIFQADNTLSSDQKDIFVFQTTLWGLSSFLEEIKSFLKVYLDQNKVQFDKNTMYGRLIEEICKALNYDENLKNITLDNFQVHFRNVIFHNNYKLIPTEMIYTDHNGQVIKLDKNQLHEKASEVSAIMQVMVTWANEMNDKREKLNRK